VYSLFLSFVSILAVLPSVLLYPPTHTTVAVGGIGVGIPPVPTDDITAATLAPVHWPLAFAGVTVTPGIVSITVGGGNIAIIPALGPGISVRHSIVPCGRRMLPVSCKGA
jgi:hypothetical protein